MTVSVRKARSSAATSACAVLCLCLAGPAAISATPVTAPAPSAPEIDKSEWEAGWHVVRPGDTLEGLAERYLGSSVHWRELHLLNPLVKDPDLLFPGQRLRIFLERPTAKLSAQVMAIARDVRELPAPVPWRPAGEGDVLLERDALRTAKSASARLRFDDGATVTLSEDSLVFIRRQTAATSTLPKKEIEIQLGQVDVEGAPLDSPDSTRSGSSGRQARKRADAIEVVVAGARSLATPEDGRPLSTRSRRGADDLAQFMVFAGKSTVSAGGTSVEVPAGSGTSVAAEEAPGPVEALLPAPSDLRPAYGEEIERVAAELSWSAVSGAVHYTVEVCRDPACGAVVARTAAVATSPYQLEVEGGLPAGEIFWRVTAVAASGLDGFPSAAIRILAVDAVRPKAPTLALRTSAGRALPAGTCVAALPETQVHAIDRSGAELPWRVVLDGREISLDEFRALPLAGEHQIAARVADSRGRTADSLPVAFTLDAAAPWVDLVASSADPSAGATEAPESSTRKSSRRNRKEAAPIAACDSGLEFADASGAWSPIPCGTGAAPAAAIVELASARPIVSLRGTTGAITFGSDTTVTGEPLSLNSWDVGCGLRQLALRIVPSRYRPGRMVLEAEVSDNAGNRRVEEWHISRR